MRGCHRQVFWKGAEGGWVCQFVFTDASKLVGGCAIIRTCNVTCGAKHHRTHINTMKTNVCVCEKKASATSTCGSNLLRVCARSIPEVLCELVHFWRSFFEASCLLEIDTAETPDGTVPALAAVLASTTVPCVARSRHSSRSFAIVMFSASFVAITTSHKFQTFISSVAHSRPFVPCSSAATRRVGSVQVDGAGLRHFSG